MSDTKLQIENYLSGATLEMRDGFLWGPCPKNEGFGKMGIRITVSDMSFCCFACRLQGSKSDLIWHVYGSAV